MYQYGGFRSHKTFLNKTEGELDRTGAFIFVEVTAGATDTLFFPNGKDVNTGDLHPVEPIPVKAGETRRIPLRLYNFRSDNPITVVAYRM